MIKFRSEFKFERLSVSLLIDASQNGTQRIPRTDFIRVRELTVLVALENAMHGLLPLHWHEDVLNEIVPNQLRFAVRFRRHVGDHLQANETVKPKVVNYFAGITESSSARTCIAGALIST